LKGAVVRTLRRMAREQTRGQPRHYKEAYGKMKDLYRKKHPAIVDAMKDYGY